MFAHQLTRSPFVIRRGHASHSIHYSRLLALGLFLALLGGCTSLPPTSLAGADPADPAAPTRPSAHRGTVGSYATARPVDAGSWQEQNERIAPVKP